MKKPHKLKIPTLKGNQWADKDEVMLHACFTLLENFIEEEDPFNRDDWTLNESDKKAKKELTTLYEWWKLKKSSRVGIEYDTGEPQEMLERLIKVREFLWI